MPALGHRAPGPVAALLEDERVTVELINDGTHLHPAVLQLAFRHAGAARVAFITDAMDAAGMGDGMYPLGPMRSRSRTASRASARPEGRFDRGLHPHPGPRLPRAVTVDGLTVDQAVQALSANPARLLGIDDRTGSLRPARTPTWWCWTRHTT